MGGKKIERFFAINICWSISGISHLFSWQNCGQAF
jgi:hypothetical protein